MKRHQTPNHKEMQPLQIKWAQWKDRLFLRLGVVDAVPSSVGIALDGVVRRADAAYQPDQQAMELNQHERRVLTIRVCGRGPVKGKQKQQGRSANEDKKERGEVAVGSLVHYRASVTLYQPCVLRRMSWTFEGECIRLTIWKVMNLMSCSNLLLLAGWGKEWEGMFSA